MTVALLAFLWLASMVLLGFLALRFIVDRDRDHPAEFWLPLSFGLGILLNGWAGLLALNVAQTLPKWSYWLPHGVLLLANIAAARYAAPLARFRGMAFFDNLRADPWRTPALIGAGGVLYAIAIFHFVAIAYPFESYDGRAIWLYKSHILFHERTVFGESFLDPYRLHYHPNYPLLVPLTTVRLFDLIGSFKGDWARIFYSTFFGLFGLYLFHELRRQLPRALAALGVALFLCLPFREKWAFWDAAAVNSCEADFFITFFATVSALAWHRWWLERRRQDWILGTLFLSAALLTKAEGMVFLASLVAACGLRWLFHAADEGARPAMRTLLPLAAGAVLALAIALPSILIVKMLPNFYDEKYASMLRPEVFEAIPGRMRIIYLQFKWELMGDDRWDIVGWDKWGVFGVAYFWMLPVAAFFLLRRRLFFIDALILAWMAAYVVTYCFSPLNLNFHMNTSMRRLFTQMYPLIVLRALWFWWEAVCWCVRPKGEDAPGG